MLKPSPFSGSPAFCSETESPTDWKKNSCMKLALRKDGRGPQTWQMQTFWLIHERSVSTQQKRNADGPVEVSFKMQPLLFMTPRSRTNRNPTEPGRVTLPHRWKCPRQSFIKAVVPWNECLWNVGDWAGVKKLWQQWLYLDKAPITTGSWVGQLGSAAGKFITQWKSASILRQLTWKKNSVRAGFGFQCLTLKGWPADSIWIWILLRHSRGLFRSLFGRDLRDMPVFIFFLITGMLVNRLKNALKVE